MNIRPLYVITALIAGIVGLSVSLVCDALGIPDFSFLASILTGALIGIFTAWLEHRRELRQIDALLRRMEGQSMDEQNLVNWIMAGGWTKDLSKTNPTFPKSPGILYPGGLYVAEVYRMRTPDERSIYCARHRGESFYGPQTECAVWLWTKVHGRNRLTSARTGRWTG